MKLSQEAKRKRIEQWLTYFKDIGLKHEVLSDSPCHVRLEIGMDVWPATGTLFIIDKNTSFRVNEPEDIFHRDRWKERYKGRSRQRRLWPQRQAFGCSSEEWNRRVAAQEGDAPWE